MGLSAADVAAVTDRNYGYGCCNGWGNNGMFGSEMWIFALLILPMLWGGNMWGNRNGEPVSESGLCNAMNFNNLENSVGRLNDVVQQGFSNLGYEQLNQVNNLQRDLCTGFASVTASVNAAAAQQAQCCYDTKQLLLENRYLAERNAANSDAVTVAQTQKILDALCGNRMADMQNQINQLQLQNALCGIVRYPTSTTFATNCNPFFGGFGCGCNNNGCCGSNI